MCVARLTRMANLRVHILRAYLSTGPRMRLLGLHCVDVLSAALADPRGLSGRPTVVYKAVECNAAMRVERQTMLIRPTIGRASPYSVRMNACLMSQRKVSGSCGIRTPSSSRTIYEQKLSSPEGVLLGKHHVGAAMKSYETPR